MADLLTRRGLFLLLGGVSGAGLGAIVAQRRGEDPVVDASQPPRGWLRPPGAQPEEHFLGACLRCGQCVEACPIATLELADLQAGLACGAPYVDSRAVSCDLCAGHDSLLCVDACPTDALLPVEEYREIRMGVALIDRDRCLSWQGTACRACWHACPYPNEAITLDWRTRPSVDAAACIGCGKCDHACLTEPSSILMVSQAEYVSGTPTHVGEGSLPF